MVNSLGAGRSLFLVVVGFVFGLALIAGPYLQHIGAFDPIPYRVTGADWKRTGGYVDYRATFVKDNCTFERLVVRGVYFGEIDPAPIPWEDLHGHQGDRLEGEQAIALRIGPMDVEYDALEIRTRHICNGHKIDRVFDRIDLR